MFIQILTYKSLMKWERAVNNITIQDSSLKSVRKTAMALLDVCLTNNDPE